MIAQEVARSLVGRWVGRNRLWLMPDTPARESETTAVIEPLAHGGFATIRYTWADDGKPHEGLMVVRLADGPDDVDMVWTDTFHMARQFMLLRGPTGGPDVLAATGSYAAPPGPDWHWRIEIRPDGPDALRIVHYNILPDGLEALAVESVYRRSA